MIATNKHALEEWMGIFKRELEFIPDKNKEHYPDLPAGLKNAALNPGDTIRAFDKDGKAVPPTDGGGDGGGVRPDPRTGGSTRDGGSLPDAGRVPLPRIAGDSVPGGIGRDISGITDVRQTPHAGKFSRHGTMLSQSQIMDPDDGGGMAQVAAKLEQLPARGSARRSSAEYIGERDRSVSDDSRRTRSKDRVGGESGGRRHSTDVRPAVGGVGKQALAELSTLAEDAAEKVGSGFLRK